jgi:hypothetical protein
LLTNFLQGYHSKYFLAFSGKIGPRPVFRPSRSYYRPLGENTSVGRRFRLHWDTLFYFTGWCKYILDKQVNKPWAGGLPAGVQSGKMFGYGEFPKYCACSK